MSASPHLSPRRALAFARITLGAGVVLAVPACSSSSHGASSTTTRAVSPASTTTGTVSPASLLASATTDARAQGWVHVVVTDHHGTETANITQDSGPDQGEQNIQKSGVAAKVILVNRNAYIQGNSEAVTSYFGFPASDGPTLAGHWISISPSDSAYDTVTAGVSLTSVLEEAGLTGNLTEIGRTVRDGQEVIGISGTASSPDAGGGAATLYLTTTSHPLPVEFDTTSSQGTEQAVFSDWGKSVFLSTPGGATPFASIASS